MEDELLHENEIQRFKQKIINLQKEKIGLQYLLNSSQDEIIKLRKYIRELEESVLIKRTYFKPGFNSPHVQEEHQQSKKSLPNLSHISNGQGQKKNTKQDNKDEVLTSNAMSLEFNHTTSGRNNHRTACSVNNQYLSRDNSGPSRKVNTCRACLNGKICRFSDEKCWYVHPPKGFTVIKGNSKECCSGVKQSKPCMCNRTNPEKEDYLYKLNELNEE